MNGCALTLRPPTKYLGLVLCSAVLLYYDVVPDLVRDWLTDENYSHGLLIPPVIAYLYWLRMGKWKEVPTSPTNAGVVLYLVGLVLFLLGRFGAESYLLRVSFLLVFSGGVLCFFGLKALRFFLPGIVLFLLALPIPYLVYDAVTFPLRLFVSRFASAILQAMGVPLLVDGNVITVPGLKLFVEDACSGIRSVMTFVALGAVAVFYTDVKGWIRPIFCVILAVVVAITTNIIRIIGTVLLTVYVNTRIAEGFYHMLSGWAFTVLGLATYVLLLFVMVRTRE